MASVVCFLGYFSVKSLLQNETLLLYNGLRISFISKITGAVYGPVKWLTLPGLHVRRSPWIEPWGTPSDFCPLRWEITDWHKDTLFIRSDWNQFGQIICSRSGFSVWFLVVLVFVGGSFSYSSWFPFINALFLLPLNVLSFICNRFNLLLTRKGWVIKSK